MPSLDIIKHKSQYGIKNYIKLITGAQLQLNSPGAQLQLNSPQANPQSRRVVGVTKHTEGRVLKISTNQLEQYIALDT